jgi:hypothetical protein
MKSYCYQVFFGFSRFRDQAQAKETGIAVDIETDPRRLRPGEIDPNPHTKVEISY